MIGALGYFFVFYGILIHKKGFQNEREAFFDLKR